MSSTLDNVALANSYATIDGLVVVNANELFVNGQAVTGDVGVYLPYTGGVMTGNIQMNTNYIQSSHVPSSVSEYTNKAYVDAAVSGLSGTYVPYVGATSNLDIGSNSMTAQNIIVGNSTTAGTLSFGAPAGYLPWKISTDSLGKLKFRTASGATPILFSIDSVGNIITAGTVTASTAQFTGITSATPSLALGVDGSGNLNSFPVPTSVNLLPLNNTWTGTNQFNQPVYFAGSGSFLNSIISGSATLAQDNSTNVNRVQFTGSGGIYNEYIYAHTGTNTNYDAQIQVSNTTANPTTNNTGQMSIYAGSVALPQTSITASSLTPLTVTHVGTFQPTCLLTSSSSDTALDLVNTAVSGRVWRLGSAGTGSGGGVGNFYIYDSTGATVWFTISSSGLTTIKGNGTILGNLTVIGYANTGILTATFPSGSLASTPTFTCSNNPPVAYPSRFWFINWASGGAYNSLVQAGDFLMVNLDAGTSSSPYYNQAGTVIGGWNQTAGLRVGTNTISMNGAVTMSSALTVTGVVKTASELQLYNSSTFVRFVPDVSSVYLECGTSSGGNPVNPSVVPLYITGMYGGNPMAGFATNGNFGCGGITQPSYTLDMGGSSANVNARNAGYNWFIAQTGLGYWDNNTRYGSGGSNWRMYGYSNLQIQAGTNASFSNGSSGFDVNSGNLGAIWNTVSPASGNVGSWNSYGGGFTIFSSSPAPSGGTAGLGIGVYNAGTSSANWIVSLSPGAAWLPLVIYNSQTTFTYYGSACGYTVGAGGANVSDAREKHTINDYPSQKSLAKILKLKPKTYKRVHYDKNAKGEAHTPAPDHVKEKVHIGLLAQEVLEVNPACVSTFINEAIVSETETGERYGICYDDFIVHLIGAVQEHDKTITALTADCSVITAQASTITSQAAQITTLTETVSSLTSQVNSLTGTVSSLTGTVSSLTGTVTSLIASITAMKSTLSTALRITL